MSDLNLINTLQLKIFVTVAEERTLKAAAVKIGQTPSAISQNIKALENFLGRQLPLDFYSGAVGPHRIADKPMKN